MITVACIFMGYCALLLWTESWNAKRDAMLREIAHTHTMLAIQGIYNRATDESTK